MFLSGLISLNLKQNCLSAPHHFWFSPLSPLKSHLHLFPTCSDSCSCCSTESSLPKATSGLFAADFGVSSFSCGLLDRCAPRYLTPSIWLLQHASLCFPFYPSDRSSRLPFWASLPLPVPYTLAFPKGFWSSCWHSLLKGFIHSHGFNYDVYAGNLITYDSFSRSISQG